MKRRLFLSFFLIGLLAHCASVPRQPEPGPVAPEPVPTPVSVAPPHEEPPPPVEPQPEPYVHIVRWTGETLSHIALWYTGSQNNWKKIAEANGGLKPLRIDLGDSILIPGELVKTRTPMPREHLRSLASPRNTRQTGSLQPQEGPGGEGLFGPVELLPPQETSETTELYGPVEVLQEPQGP